MRWRLSDGCDLCLVDGEYCAFNCKGDFASFNEVGCAVIGCVDEGQSEDEIVEILEARYGACRDVLWKDVAAFFNDLEVHGFLEKAD